MLDFVHVLHERPVGFPVMKRTYPIQQGEYWNLLKKFIADFGYPTYYEELVIYIESKDNFNITLNRKGITWSWADDKIEGKYKRHNHYFTTNLKDIKEKILFITKYYGNRGHISIAPVFSFIDNETEIIIEMRPQSLIGEIISMIIPDELLHDENNKERFSIFFGEQIKPHLGDDLLKKTSKLKNINEEFIHFNISESPILNTKLIDFCRKNGIMNPFKKNCTYRNILSSKSNNYGNYEDLFYQMTKINLLSNTEHCSLPKAVKMNNISIIIPCYNTEITINKVLKSIQYQKIDEDYFKNIEVIIIDDNSSEEISKFIDVNRYKFKIQIIRLNHNHGISHARQLGVTHATGNILIFIDSDVILSKNYLADHLVRNVIIDNAVFVSFKENVSQNDIRISDNSIENGIGLPKYSKDLRIYKKVDSNAIGSYKVNKSLELISLKIFNIWDPAYDKNFWEAIIELPDTYSLFEFHLFIQHITNFDNDHLFEFYAGRNERNRKKLFSEKSGYPYDGGEYERILLKDIYPLKGLKLYYLFDFGDNWIFEIHKNRKKAKIQEVLEYPRIVSDNRIKLRQYYYEDE